MILEKFQVAYFHLMTEISELNDRTICSSVIYQKIHEVLKHAKMCRTRNMQNNSEGRKTF